MTQPHRDLWPDSIEVIQREATPVMILKEQASLLGEKTQNMVLAEVRSKIEQTSNYFVDDFYLVAPLLGNYRFQLFRIRRQLEHLYPVQIKSEALGLDKDIESEDQFTNVLSDVFSHERTINIIASMLAQSEAVPISDNIPF